MTPTERRKVALERRRACDAAWLLGAGSVGAVWLAWAVWGDAVRTLLGGLW